MDKGYWSTTFLTPHKEDAIRIRATVRVLYSMLQIYLPRKGIEKKKSGYKKYISEKKKKQNVKKKKNNENTP